MTRDVAAKLLREELDKHGLTEWRIRLTTNLSANFLALCSYKDKCIIFQVYAVETNADEAVIQVIKHEVAHALVGPEHGHDSVWAAKAREIGCTNTLACPGYSMPAHIIDAIRSGADVEITYETETQVIHRPKYQVTRLQDKCEKCGAVAKETRSSTLNGKGDKPDTKFIFLECGHVIIKSIPKGTPFHELTSNWWKNGNSKCVHEWNPNDYRECMKCGETRLYKFQVEGAQFLEQALAVNSGGAIFDEMGLGKTVQDLAYLRYTKDAFPVLFVLKSGIKFQWFKEVLKWLGPDFIGQVVETSKDFIIPNLKCYFVSYDIFTFKSRKLKSGKTVTQGMDIKNFDFIKTVVLDECQQIKNPDAARTQQIRKLVKDKKVIGLSGTPWKNNGAEYFTILNMLAPMKFPTYQGFLNRWVDFDAKGKPCGIRNIERFKEYIKDIAIRREVFEVGIQMPDVVRSMYYTELNPMESKLYDEEEDRFVQWYNQHIIGGTEESVGMQIQAELNHMRHLTGLAKIPGTLSFTEDFYESTDRKLTIFGHHKDVCSILYDELKRTYEPLGVPVYRLSADLNGQERFEVAEAFQNAKRAFLVASTLASGEGINLQTCGDAILHERQWNPQNEDQAAPGRFRRIGASHSRVNVTFMTAAGTVDEILGNIVEKKRAYFHSSMNKGDAVQWSEGNLMQEVANEILMKHREKNKRFAVR